MMYEEAYVPIRRNSGPVEDGVVDGADFVALSDHIRGRWFPWSTGVILLAVGAPLLILSFVCGSILHPIHLSSEMKSRPNVNQSKLDKLHAYLPPFQSQEVAFEFDWAFGGDPNPNITAAWLSLIPKGQGVVKLPSTHEYGSNIYNIAGFHSIHCLYTLRESFFAFNKIINESTKSEAPDVAHRLEHGRHCFEYLRQVLTCTPDINLEPVEGSTGHLKTWGFQRKCVNFQALSDWAHEMRARNDWSIV